MNDNIHMKKKELENIQRYIPIKNLLVNKLQCSTLYVFDHMRVYSEIQV